MSNQEGNNSENSDQFQPEVPLGSNPVLAGHSKMLHDIRSPLTSILGMTEIIKLLLTDSRTDLGEVAWYIQQIEYEALRMRTMLNQPD